MGYMFSYYEFCQTLSLSFTERDPWRCLGRQLSPPHSPAPRPSAVCEINNEAEQLSLLRSGSLDYVSLLIDVMAIS